VKRVDNYILIHNICEKKKPERRCEDLWRKKFDKSGEQIPNVQKFEKKEKKEKR